MDIDYNMPVGNMQTFYERKLSKFLIMFDNSNLLYFPGQFLSGRVIVELQDEMAITGQWSQSSHYHQIFLLAPIKIDSSS